MASHSLQCRCGALKGLVHELHTTNRAVCYCRDCQAFAHFLGRADEVLDERGGSDIIQVAPRHVVFTQGIGTLACMRLTPKGLMRWYAACCKTPIGNTLPTRKVSYVGLVHTCLEGKASGARAGAAQGEAAGSKSSSLDEVFGPVRSWVNTGGARGEPKPKVVGHGRVIRWFFRTVPIARFNGNYRKTPFFDVTTGRPVVAPRVLTEAEHAEVMAAVRAGT
jgi:hypothetical protein